VEVNARSNETVAPAASVEAVITARTACAICRPSSGTLNRVCWMRSGVGENYPATYRDIPSPSLVVA
jgi:hypothetical protein